MKNGKKQILEMVMARRITPAEAERLLMAWNDERESRWIFGACAAPAVVNFGHAVWLHIVSSGGMHSAGLVSWIVGGVR
jgi:hypothetical protein